MKLKSMFIVSIITLLFMSCATSIPVSVTVPPRMNYNKADSIGILPVTTAETEAASALKKDGLRSWWYTKNLSDDMVLATYLTSKVEEILASSDFFKVVSSDQLQKQVEAGNISVQALISGKILSVVNDYEEGYEEFTDLNGKIINKYYIKNMSNIEVSFKILDPIDFSIIDSFSAKASAYDTDSSWDQVDSYNSLQKQALDKIIQSNKYQFIPRTYRQYRTMAKLANKKDPRTEKVDQFIDNGFYQEAYDLFISIYNDSSDSGALYNAILLQEILGDLDGALVEMTNFAKSTGDSNAVKQMNRMKKAIANREALKK